MKKTLLCLFLSSLILFTSCATIFSGRNDRVRVEAGNPAAAKVYYNGSYVGNAPCVIKVPKADLKNNMATIVIKMDGYEDQTIVLTRKLKLGAVVGDCLTGFIWLIVDFADSAIYKSSKNVVRYDLQKKSFSGSERRRVFTIRLAEEHCLLR